MVGPARLPMKPRANEAGCALVMAVGDAPAATFAARVAALPVGLSALPLLLIVDKESPHATEIEDWCAQQTRPLALLPLNAEPAALRVALEAVAQGLSVRVAGSGGGGAPPPSLPASMPTADHEPLTAREIEVFELLGKGLSNRDIAGVLGISAHTAKFHVGQILAKLGVATRAEAVGQGLKMGLIGV